MWHSGASEGPELEAEELAPAKDSTAAEKWSCVLQGPLVSKF